MKPEKKTSLAQSLIDDLLIDESSDSSSQVKSQIDLDDSTDAQVLDLNQIEGDHVGDKTLALPAPAEKDIGDAVPTDSTKIAIAHKDQHPAHKEEKVSIGIGRSHTFGAGPLSSVGLALAQSENLKIAQNRILDLEKEVERLRKDNEQLAAAGETFKRRGDELVAENEQLIQKLSHEQSIANQERELLQKTLALKKRDNETLRLKIDELEGRLSVNIQKIRVRERELENRLELVKMEGQTLVRSKDEYILELKRQNDQQNIEMESFRHKSQEMNKQLAERQEILRRTVKALRLALSMLEGEDQIGEKKKVG